MAYTIGINHVYTISKSNCDMSSNPKINLNFNFEKLKPLLWDNVNQSNFFSYFFRSGICSSPPSLKLASLILRWLQKLQCIFNVTIEPFSQYFSPLSLSIHSWLLHWLSLTLFTRKWFLSAEHTFSCSFIFSLLAHKCIHSAHIALNC